MGDCRVMLIVVLCGKGMHRIGIPIQVGNTLVGQEEGCTRFLGVLWKCFNSRRIRCIQGERIWIRPWNYAVCGTAVVEQGIRNRVNVPRRRTDVAV